MLRADPYLRCARGGGLEPPITGPEPVVLPITPPPNGRSVTLPKGLSAAGGPGLDLAELLVDADETAEPHDAARRHRQRFLAEVGHSRRAVDRRGAGGRHVGGEAEL